MSYQEDHEKVLKQIKILDTDLRSCGGKKKFKTKSKAETHMKQVAAKPNAKAPELLHVYECPLCHYWHIGHSTDKTENRIRSILEKH